jgi:mRNA interferase HigB
MLQLTAYIMSTALKRAGVELGTWFTKIKKAEYKTPAEIIKDFKGADYVSGFMVFNINKNKYRLIAAFRHDTQICYIHFIGTHSEYDKIDLKRWAFNLKNDGRTIDKSDKNRRTV